MARKQDVIFRGSKEGLELIFNDELDYETLKEKLKAHLERAEMFFQGADVVLDIGNLEFSIDQILEIQNILAFPHGLRIKKVVRGGRDLRPVAKAAREQRTSETEDRNIEQKRNIVENRAPAPTRSDTLLYKGTLRSGQRITYEGNVVVVGDVNPGAEIRAGGDIIIMGTLRGLAHAGAGGAPDAMIAAFRLEPTQIRIGDVIGRPPEGDLGIPREPEVARLKDGVILVEPLDVSRWEGER